MSDALPADVSALLDAQSDRYGIPRVFARAIAWIESRGKQSARGQAGELGVMQLLPATAKGLGVDASDLNQNIEGGVRLLAGLLKRYGEAGGLASYNGGPRYGTKPRDMWPAQVQRYVDLVQARVEVESNTMGARTAGAPFPEQERTPVRRRRSQSPSSGGASASPTTSAKNAGSGDKTKA